MQDAGQWMQRKKALLDGSVRPALANLANRWSGKHKEKGRPGAAFRKSR